MSKKFTRRNALILGGGVALGALGIGATAEATSSSASEWIRLPVITANIGRKNLGARERAIRDVRKGDSGHRPLVGWQEICEGDTGERPMIGKHFGDHYKSPFLWSEKSYRVPMSIPTHWTVHNRVETFVHGGVKGKTPPRWITEIIVKHVKHPELAFALINTHYVANAYNGNKEPALQKKWKLHKELHKERILAHHSAGRPVIWTGDVNHPGYKTASGKKAERQVFAKGIDKINWLPAGDKIQIELQNKHKVPMHVDGHDAGVAVFRVRLT